MILDVRLDAQLFHRKHTQQRLSIGRKLKAAEVTPTASDGQAGVAVEAGLGRAVRGLDGYFPVELESKLCDHRGR